MNRRFEKINLSPRQLEVLRTIEIYQSSKRCSATIADLAETLNLSRSTVFEHIAALREQKLLKASTGRARCLKLTRLASQLLERKTEIDIPERMLAPGQTLGKKFTRAAGRIEIMEAEYGF